MRFLLLFLKELKEFIFNHPITYLQAITLIISNIIDAATIDVILFF